MADESNGNGGWMADVQRALALLLIGTLAVSIVMITIRIVIWGDAPSLLDMVKNLQSALINMTMVALGFFFGSNMSKEKADASQQKIVEKLTSSAPPATGPVAPVVAVVATATPWWSALTDAEKTAITNAATTDPRAMAFLAAANAGHAGVDDLVYLVGKGLLTQDRADIIAKV